MRDVRPLAEGFSACVRFPVSLRLELVVMTECLVLVAVSAGRTRSAASADFGPVAVPRVVSRSRVDVTGCPQSSSHCVRAPGRWSTSPWMKMVSTASRPHSCCHTTLSSLPGAQLLWGCLSLADFNLMCSFSASCSVQLQMCVCFFLLLLKHLVVEKHTAIQ